MITAPFNFVPLSDRVFFPPWAEKISHDIPFEDGQSGMIDITITAKSPIFIRDGEDEKEFCNYNGRYFIPGSSVKGMVRNILEIMSFGKMSQVDDDTYAVRDLSNRELYMSRMKPQKTFCGWLRQSETNPGKYIIEDCGHPGRIRLDKIGDTLYSTFYEHYDEKDDKTKTAEFKYELFSNETLPTKFRHKKNENGKEIYLPGDDKKGTIVFTGQPSKRKEGKKASGKIYEFIFFESIGELEVSDEVFSRFKSAYFDGRKTEPKESADWAFWKRKLAQGEKVPVFFQKNGNQLAHFGLSYLYKLPYKHGIHDAIRSVSPLHFDERLDLAQSIFGFVNEKTKTALKGRVQFSHFPAESQSPAKCKKSITTVLGTPRASYYPVYIKQNHDNGSQIVDDGRYNTLMDDNAQVAGWKRYPLHAGKPSPPAKNPEEKTTVTFRPLGRYDGDTFQEVTFRGKLRYHNLLPVELGAILSALTFHGHDAMYHSIGMAKPYGFGKVKIQVIMDGNRQAEYMRLFEEEMENFMDNGWLTSPQMTELFSMANGHLAIDGLLRYMVLDPEHNRDDFREKKNEKSYLPLVSKLAKSTPVLLKSLRDRSVYDAFVQYQSDYQKAIEAAQKRRKEQEERLASTPPAQSKEFKKAIEAFVRSKVALPYYEYKDLKLLIFEREDEIVADDKYNAYLDLAEDATYQTIEPLLRKRDNGTATEEELAELYNYLTAI